MIRSITRHPAHWVVMGSLSAASALLSLMAFPAHAQSTNASGLSDPDSSDAKATPFSNSSSAFGGMFQLMHQLQMGQIRSSSEFSQDQQQSLGTAAQDFRERQRQMLQQGQQPGGPAMTPQTVTPSAPPAN